MGQHHADYRLSLHTTLADVHGSSYAASAHEREQLSLIQRQLDTIERLATRAKAARTAEPNERYRFDYLRLSKDIQRIRQGCRAICPPLALNPAILVNWSAITAWTHRPRSRRHEHD